MNRQRFGWLFVVAACFQVPAAFGRPDEDDSLARAQARGTLLFAMDPTYPPMEFQEDGGALAGFDVDLARALAAKMGLKAELVTMSWEGIIAGLQSRRYDAIISAMNVTQERSKQVDFLEYARMAQVFVCPTSGATVKTERDMIGKVMAVAADTTSFDWVSGRKKAGLALKEIKAYRMSAEVFLALKAGHAEAAVVDEPVARYFARQDPSHLNVTGEAMSPEPLGIAVAKGQQKLLTALAAALNGLRKDGTVASLERQWFGASRSLLH